MEIMDIIKIQTILFIGLTKVSREEIPLTVEVNGHELATLLCSPENLDNLVTGFLFTSGLIKDFPSLKSLIIDTERFNAAARIEGDESELFYSSGYTPRAAEKGLSSTTPWMSYTRQP